jgi:hypothetical protein
LLDIVFRVCNRTGPIFLQSGDSDLSGLLESIRIKERLPALAAAIIIDGKIYAAAAVGTRKSNTDNWVTVDSKIETITVRLR